MKKINKINDNEIEIEEVFNKTYRKDELLRKKEIYERNIIEIDNLLKEF